MEILGEDTVDQAYQHDLESFFYVLLWICTFYTGSGTQKTGLDAHTTPMYQWKEQETTKEFHMRWFVYMVLPHFTEFFREFTDLAQELYDVMFPGGNLAASQSTVTHKSFIHILEAKLTELTMQSRLVQVATSIQPSTMKPALPQPSTMKPALLHVEVAKRMLASSVSPMSAEGPYSDPSVRCHT